MKHSTQQHSLIARKMQVDHILDHKTNLNMLKELKYVLQS